MFLTSPIVEYMNIGVVFLFSWQFFNIGMSARQDRMKIYTEFNSATWIRLSKYLRILIIELTLHKLSLRDFQKFDVLNSNLANFLSAKYRI